MLREDLAETVNTSFIICSWAELIRTFPNTYNLFNIIIQINTTMNIISHMINRQNTFMRSKYQDDVKSNCIVYTTFNQFAFDSSSPRIGMYFFQMGPGFWGPQSWFLEGPMEPLDTFRPSGVQRRWDNLQDLPEQFSNAFLRSKNLNTYELNSAWGSQILKSP